jgi:hypothetical protein
VSSKEGGVILTVSAALHNFTDCLFLDIIYLKGTIIMSAEKEGEEYTKIEIDPQTGTVEKKDRHQQARELPEKPEDWREQK